MGFFFPFPVPPDYHYLAAKSGITNKEELETALLQTIDKVNIKLKSQDFVHLLFNKNNSDKILRFRDFLVS